MNNNSKALMVVVITLITGFLAFKSFQNLQTVPNLIEQSTTEYTDIEINGVTIKAELAKTDAQKAAGLMNRTQLGRYSGMLFIYNNEAQRTFWMRNTLISLDIIFLNAEKEVVSISAQTTPNQTDKLYYSMFPAQYILELNAGMAEELELKPGNTIEF